MKKILGLGTARFGTARFGIAAIAIPAAIASATLIHPAIALSQPVSANPVNVVGEPYYKAVSILKGQGINQRFNGSTTGPGGVPQSQCIVDRQTSTSKGLMLLHLDCTAKAAAGAVDSAPETPAPGAAPGGVTPGAGQGTYGGPIGVPVPVG